MDKTGQERCVIYKQTPWLHFHVSLHCLVARIHAHALRHTHTTHTITLTHAEPPIVRRRISEETKEKPRCHSNERAHAGSSSTLV